jgi:hypothetical protein
MYEALDLINNTIKKKKERKKAKRTAVLLRSHSAVF